MTTSSASCTICAILTGTRPVPGGLLFRDAHAGAWQDTSGGAASAASVGVVRIAPLRHAGHYYLLSVAERAIVEALSERLGVALRATTGATRVIRHDESDRVGGGHAYTQLAADHASRVRPPRHDWLQDPRLHNQATRAGVLADLAAALRPYVQPPPAAPARAARRRRGGQRPG